MTTTRRTSNLRCQVALTLNSLHLHLPLPQLKVVSAWSFTNAAAQEADRLKEEGNKALQSGDVRKALDLYTASLAKHATGRWIRR